MLSGAALRGDLWRGLANTDIDRDNKSFDWLNDVTDLHHNAFVMSASKNKIVSAFHLFHCIFSIKSAYNA